MTLESALAGLLNLAPALPPDMSLSDAADQLLSPELRSLLSLAVIDPQGRPIGLVSRSAVQDIFMRRFGRDLRGRDPVCGLMNAAPLILSLNLSLEAASQQVTAQLSYPITEDFILVDGEGRYQGLGTVLDLLKAMEKRIAQRNQVLRQALVDLKESQVQLVQSEKMASLGQMVAGVAHELNTPLGYVTNNLQLLDDLTRPFIEDGRDAELADDLRQLFNDTLYGLEQIGELVRGLKDFARLDRAHSEQVDLNECVRSAVLIARTQTRDKARVDCELGELPRLACAPSQINQVMLNLLSNAAQAMEGFGRILIKTWADDAAVFVSVQDSGRGMSADICARIFDPFFTTKPVGQGTGLGLSISFKIIQDHGGSIRVASVPGRGTRFLIRLPRPASVADSGNLRLSA